MGKNRTVGRGQRGAGEDPCAGVGPPAAEFLSFLSLKVRPSSQEWMARAADRIPDPPRQEAYGWGGLKECLSSVQLSVHTWNVLAVSIQCISSRSCARLLGSSSHC